MPDEPRIRVVFALDSLHIGGTELNAVRTAERLDRRRFDVRALVLNRSGPLLDRYLAAGIAVTEFPIKGLASPRSWRRGVQVARWLRRERIDIVHAHDVYTNILVVPSARVAGVPAVIASRRWWYTVPRPGLTRANRIASRLAHRVLANSASVARLLVREEGVPERSVLIVPNFVDEEAFRPLATIDALRLRRSWSVEDGELTVGILARLDPVKRHGDLLEAFAVTRQESSFSNWRLVIVGDGPERARLEAQARSLGISGFVTFTGMVPHTPGLPGLFDFMVLSSDAEGFPNSIIEAMAAGRAVAATSVGGVVDCVRHGETGLLVPPREPMRLADALRRLMRDRAGRERMGAAARERARRLYHGDVVIRQLEQAYVALASRRGAGRAMPAGAPVAE